METGSIEQIGQMILMYGIRTPPGPETISQRTIEEKDTDNDELLTISELGATEENFAAMDTDRDGFVSAEELIAKITEALQLDTQNDEKPNINDIKSALAELGITPPPLPSAEDITQKIVEENDTDRDGLLTLSELQVTEELFSELDTDRDGFVSAEELTAAMANKMEQAKAKFTPHEEVGITKELLDSLIKDSEDSPPPPPPPAAQTGLDTITQALEQLDLTEEEQAAILDALQNQTFDMQA